MVNSQVVTPQYNIVSWNSTVFGSHAYKPISIYEQLADLDTCNNTLDFVLLGADSVAKLNEIAEVLVGVISKKTIILIDSSYTVHIETLMYQKFPGNLILSVVSDVRVQVLQNESKYVYAHLGDTVQTMIGTTSDTVSAETADSLKGINISGKKLAKLVLLLQANGVVPCTIIKWGTVPPINSFIWKQILPFVSFSVLSLIYGKLNMEDGIYCNIIKNSFKEVLSLAFSDCKNEFPNINEIQEGEFLFNKMQTQFNMLHPNYKVASSLEPYSSFEEEVFEVPLCIYNFTKGFPTYIPLCIEQILEFAIKKKITIPYLECILSFYYKIELVRDQQLYNWISGSDYKPIQLLEDSDRLGHIHASSNQKTSDPSYQMTMDKPPIPDTVVTVTTTKKALPSEYASHQKLEIQSPGNQSSPHVHDYSSSLMETMIPVDPFKSSTKQHPRFKNIPRETINGRHIAYHPIKKLIYPHTKGSTSAQTLTDAYKHIYKNSNLNGTFESVNNRYGMSDSLESFKLFTGFKDGVEESRDGYRESGQENIVLEEKKLACKKKEPKLQNYNLDSSVSKESHALHQDSLDGPSLDIAMQSGRAELIENDCGSNNDVGITDAEETVL